MAPKNTLCIWYDGTALDAELERQDLAKGAVPGVESKVRSHGDLGAQVAQLEAGAVALAHGLRQQRAAQLPVHQSGNEFARYGCHLFTTACQPGFQEAAGFF